MNDQICCRYLRYLQSTLKGHIVERIVRPFTVKQIIVHLGRGRLNRVRKFGVVQLGYGELGLIHLKKIGQGFADGVVQDGYRVSIVYVVEFVFDPIELHRELAVIIDSNRSK